ncbi:MAG: hypothetical protein AAGA30_02135 [Planctomycetota bacterium]
MSQLPIGKALLAPLLLASFFAVEAKSQTIQLPTYRIFGARTVVRVPDRGTVGVGGNNRLGKNSSKLGFPAFPSPLTKKRTVSGFTRSSKIRMATNMISLRRMELSVRAEAYKRRLKDQAVDPNGSQEVQAEADFISDNIGRSGR